MSIRLYTNTKIIDYSNINIIDFKKALENLCDEDFNGGNSPDCLISYQISSGKVKLMSRFDIVWNNCIKKSNFNIKDDGYTAIKTILKNAYRYDSYYKEYNVHIYDIDSKFIIFIAYTTCV